jgi:predicted small metal-binding protein
MTMIRFRCKDIDLKDCEFQVQGDSKEEILEIVSLHLGKSHRIVNITPETRERIRRAVKG